MQVNLTVRGDYNFDVEVVCEYIDGALRFKAFLTESAMVSHFDGNADYLGATPEKAIEAIAKALDSAIEMLHSI